MLAGCSELGAHGAARSCVRASMVLPRGRHMGPSRAAVSCQFSKLPLPVSLLLQHHVEKERPAPANAEVDKYDALLQRAELITFGSSSMRENTGGQRCRLVDAERMLRMCIQERPSHLHPHVVLLRNLMRQSGGREQDVPGLAMQTLHSSVEARVDEAVTRDVKVLQAFLLGLKAVYKLQEEHRAAVAQKLPGSSSTIDTKSAPSAGLCASPLSCRYTAASFLAAAQAAAPSLAVDFQHLSLRVQRQLRCCSDEARLAMLADRDGYMSCVDLFTVLG